MRANTRLKIWVSTLVALLLLVALTLPAFAAGKNVQAVLDQLDYMQQVDIDPEWAPDVRTNESAVQRLLDLYLLCSAAERKAFTTAQNSLLRAYFEMLYSVQGKDAALVDAIFAGTVGSASSGAVSSSRRVASSSGAVPSSVTSSVAVSSASHSASAATSSSTGSSSRTVSSAVAPSSAGAALTNGASGAGSFPMPTFPPQTPKGEGRFAFMGSEALGLVLLLLLGALLLLIFLRYLGALRAAVPPKTRKKKREKPQQDEMELEYGNEPLNATPPAARFSTAFLPSNPSENIDAIDPDALPGLPPPRARRSSLPATDAAPAEAPSVPLARPEESPAEQPRAKPYRPDLPPGQTRPLGMGRTGHPPKRSFRQGDADDIDAIDD